MAQYLDSFEFTNRAGYSMGLAGELLGWAHEVQQDLVSHKILKRAGTLHQNQKRAPRHFVYRVLLSGDDATDRYVEMERQTGLEPFGELVDPRFGRVGAVCESIKAQEDLDETINTLTLEIAFTESGLREIPKQSAAGAAQGAGESAAQLVAAVASISALVAPAAAVSLAVEGFQVQVGLLGEGTLTAAALEGSLGAVQRSVEGLVAVAGSDLRRYNATALARLTFARCLSAYNLATSQRAPLVLRRVPGRISLSRWCAALVGGARARAYEAEVSRLNRIATPWGLPPGSRWLIPDPDTVVREAR